MHASLRILLALLLPFAAALPGQRTIVVQGSYTAFQDAVTIARHDDVLLVRPGTYGCNTGTNQGITILCDPGVRLEGSANGSQLGSMYVSGLPAGRTFRMRGGNFASSHALVDPLTIRDMQGAVILESVTAWRGPSIFRSRSVAMSGCRFDRVLLDRSTVSIAGCDLRGTVGSVADTAALIARNSIVSISGGRLAGGDTRLGFPASAAIWIDHGSVVISGGPSTEIRGGAGIGASAPAPAIYASGGRFDHDPRVRIVSGAPSPIVGPLVVTQRPIPALDALGAAAGQVFTATAYGEPGRRLHMLVSLPTPPRPSPFGHLWVPADAWILDSGVVPPTGMRTVSLVVPPMDLAVPFTLQPLSSVVTGELVFGPPTTVLLN